MNFSLPSQPGPTAPANSPPRDLPPRERPARRRSSPKVPIIIAALLIGGTAVVLTRAPGLGRYIGLEGLFGSDDRTMLYGKVIRGSLPVVVSERGQLESSQNKEVTNEVEGQTTIIHIVPEGTEVKQGDLVCELDSANLRDQLLNQEIVVKRAEADLEQAKKTLEVAEIAVEEYRDGTYPQEEKSAFGQIKLAQSEQVKAQDAMEWYDRMASLGLVPIPQATAARLAYDKANFTVQENTTKLEVLQRYTKAKQTTELQANVQKARSDMLAKESTYKLELAKYEKLQRQIEKCKLLAPGNGIVVYSNEQSRFGSSQQIIEDGATVRERQPIFKLPDLTQMRVNTKVHESMVDRITTGLKARIRVDAFPDKILTGTVASIAPMPDQAQFFGSDVKVYTTLVTIDNPLDGLRPGMTAQVEILVTQLDDVLSVPVQAILEFRSKDYVYVRTPNGPVRKEVKLGITNDKLIEIKEGLREGEEVALNPTELMTDDEKREAFAVASKGGTNGEWSSDAIEAGKAAAKSLTPGLAKPAAASPDIPKKSGTSEKAKGQRKGAAGGGFGGPLGEIFQRIPAEDRARMREMSETEREEVLRKAGATDEMIQQMRQFRGGGGGGFGGRGGGFGGPGGGGPPQ